MKQALIVGCGGFLGSVARYQLGSLILRYSPGWRFPLGTFTINILGCLIIGLLAGLAERQSLFSADARLFFFTGILGGFTTFSAFALESVFLLRRGEWLIAGLYTVLSVLCGFLALWLALKLAGNGSPQA